MFFGKKDCEYCLKFIKHLNLLKFDSTNFLGSKRNEKLPEEILNWSGDYIFSYKNYIILPKILLKKVKKYAINIHPGSPKYPGSGCINWALYDNAEEFGVTAHLMTEKVDDGPIIETRLFKISKEDTIKTLLKKTEKVGFNILIDVVEGIKCKGETFVNIKKNKFKNLKWSGIKRKIKDLDELQIINQNIDKKELLKIIRATKINKFGPELIIHGFKFKLKE